MFSLSSSLPEIGMDVIVLRDTGCSGCMMFDSAISDKRGTARVGIVVTKSVIESVGRHRLEMVNSSKYSS